MSKPQTTIASAITNTRAELGVTRDSPDAKL